MPVLGALMGFFFLSGATLALPAQAAAPPAPMPAYTVSLTGYNAVPWQTDDNPFETASGAYSNPEIIAARSQDLADILPFGTIIAIEGPFAKQENCGYSAVSPLIGYRVIEDTMNARYRNRIDVLFSTKANYIMSDGHTENAASLIGNCKEVTIRVVGHLDPIHTDLLPKTQATLAALVAGKSSPLVAK